MRGVRFAAAALVATCLAIIVMGPAPAEARCRTFQASHNGTDMFHPTGAVGAATNKLVWQVERWRKQKGVARVRFGKIRTKCGDWFMKYGLPHKHCVAKARVCY